MLPPPPQHLHLMQSPTLLLDALLHSPASFLLLTPTILIRGPVVRLHLGEGFLHPQRAWRNSIWPGSKVLLGAWFCLVASHRR